MLIYSPLIDGDRPLGQRWKGANKAKSTEYEGHNRGDGVRFRASVHK